MIGSILVKMPELTKEFDEEIGVEVINNYFVRLKGDIHIPLFNLPLLYPEIFYKEDDYNIVYKLVDITFRYYEKYVKLRKQKQFKVKVFLPEKYGGNALYYILQKFMINEATPEEVKIISEFLSREIFGGKDIAMYGLLSQYYDSICGLLNPELGYISYEKTIFINTPVGSTPLYVSKKFLKPDNKFILTTTYHNYTDVAFLNVLASYFFDKSVQIGSLKFRFLKSIGELDFNWKNVKVISFKELYDISDAIIENNLEMAFPRTTYTMCNDYHHTNLFLLHSPILSAVGAAIDFKNKSVVFLFAMLKRKKDYKDLTELNNTMYLNSKKEVEFFVTSVPFKNIKKSIYRKVGYSNIFIIEQSGKVIPVLLIDMFIDTVVFGVGRENIVIRYDDYSQWHSLLRRLASPEHLRTAEEKTQEWLKNKGLM